jgi:hypothetical protein
LFRAKAALNWELSGIAFLLLKNAAMLAIDAEVALGLECYCLLVQRKCYGIRAGIACLLLKYAAMLAIDVEVAIRVLLLFSAQGTLNWINLVSYNFPGIEIRSLSG